MTEWKPFSPLAAGRPASYMAPVIMILVLVLTQIYLMKKPFVPTFIHSFLIALLISI